MHEIESEVTIVGAGPAGISTALHLAKKKIPHILIDKSVFPRDKICGDALSGKVVQELNRLNPEIINEIASDHKRFLGSYGVQFIAPGGHSVDIPFSTDLSTLKCAPGYLAKRFDFDAFMVSKLETAYTTFLDNTVMNKIQYYEDGLTASILNHGDEAIIKTRLVVSAEGERSVLLRQFNLDKKEPKHFCAGIRAYYKNVEGMHPDNFIELHFLPEFLPGYLWIFPLPDGRANVGAGMLSSAVRRNKIALRQEMNKLLVNHPRFKSRFKNAILEGTVAGWGLPLGSKRRKISGEHFLLAGDSASLIDPFTGEGIGNAMVSGRIAADTIEKAVHAERYDHAFLRTYDKQVYAELGKELRLSHTLQRLSSQQWLFNYIVRKAASNQALREMITGMFEDLDLRSKLSKPSFYMNLLLNRK